jgi:hypothetical protein
VDENSAYQMQPIIDVLLRLKQKHGCGILLLHHYKKQDRDKPFFAEASRISGTSSFGRWYESLLLIERGSEAHQVRLVPRHRMSAPGAGLLVDFDMGPMGDTWYDPIVTKPKDEAADQFDQIRKAIGAEPGVTIADLAKSMDLRGERLRRYVEKMPDVELVEQAARRSPKLFLRKR